MARGRLALKTTGGAPVRKREKYTRRACETCKTRKVKCSGQVPCSRCTELGADCLYHDAFAEPVNDIPAASGRAAKRRRTSNFSNPELEQLVLTMRKVCDDIESSASNYDLAAIPAYSLKRSQNHVLSGSPVAVNPTPPYAHLFNLARDTLQQRGLFETPISRARSKKPAAADGACLSTPAEDILRAAKPILHFGHEKALQYFSIFKHHIYSAYPCISLSVAMVRMSALYNVRNPPAGVSLSEDLGLDLIDVEIMKATFAIAMILEGENDNPLCLDLTAHLLWNVDNNMHEDRAQVEDIIMAILVAIYWTLKHQPLKSWRMIGFAARMCFELGLHRDNLAEDSDSDQPTSPQLREIFSCVYDLDKRCSFFANLPWSLHYQDIDADVLSLDDKHPYLSAMLALDRVHIEITRFNSAGPPSGSKEMEEQSEIYDYRVQKLVDNIFAKGLFPSHMPDMPPAELQNVMSSILRLRANQVRMLSYTRYLSSSCDGSSYKDQAIHILVSLALSSVDLYLAISGAGLLWGPLADRLMMGSISCMFLAASQNPYKYGPLCREAFHTAINCVNQSPYEHAKSESEGWCSLEELRGFGDKIQMPPLDESPAAQAPPVDCFNAVPDFDGQLQFSAEELAHVCESTSQDSVSGLWEAASFWESEFDGFHPA